MNDVTAKSAEEWAAEKATPDWLFVATKYSRRWALGRVLTEAEYDAAVEATKSLRMTPGDHFITSHVPAPESPPATLPETGEGQE